MDISKIVQLTNEPRAPRLETSVDCPSVRRALRRSDALPTDHALQHGVAMEFKAGKSMRALAMQYGVDVLVIEDVIRQLLWRQTPVRELP